MLRDHESALGNIKVKEKEKYSSGIRLYISFHFNYHKIVLYATSGEDIRKIENRPE